LPEHPNIERPGNQLNFHKSALAKTMIAFVASLLCVAWVAGPAGAANRFLNSPVPIQGQPLLDSNGGVFDMAESDSGEAVAFWGQSDGLFASIRPANGKFGAPVLITPNVQGTALPQVAMNSSGYAILIWREEVAGEEQVMSSVHSAGGSTFTAPAQVSAETFDIPARQAQVAVDNAGNALVVWRALDSNGNDATSRIRKRYVLPGGAIGLPATNVSPGQGVDAPKVAMGPNGHALVSWVEGDTITGDPATLWLGPNGADPDYQSFDTNSGSSLVAGVDAAGNTVIANQVGNDVIGNNRPAGAGQNFLFNQSLKLPGGTVSRPAIGMDSSGRATVAFGYFQAGKGGIQTVERAAGGDTLFGTTVKSITDTAQLSKTDIAVGANGTTILGWTTIENKIFSAVRDSGAPQFGVPTGPISAAPEPGEIHVTADANGKALIAYSTSTAPADDFTLNVLPYDDVPVAADLTIPTTVIQGQETQFSVNPVDAWADVTGVDWDVDTGVNKPGNVVTHTYLTPGERMVVVNLTDSLGNKTTAGQLIDVQPDTIAPVVSKFKIQKKKFKRGKKNAFRFNVNDKVKVTIKVKRTSKGKGKRAQGQIVKKNVAPGSRKVGFRGKVGKRKLKPANYQATIVAVDPFGNRSKPRKVGFRIIR